jgi:hypothetical protein
MDKMCYIQKMEYYPALQTNDLLSHEKTWRKLKCDIYYLRKKREERGWGRVGRGGEYGGIHI